jgi:hypothetical protein
VVADIVANQMDEQRTLESQNCSIIDAACEPTAQMMKKLSDYVLGEYATEDTGGLCYAIGKWIYLADALDDYDKDVKKGRYNVLYNAYGVTNKVEALKKGEGELTFIFNSLFAEMRQHLAKIKFYFNHDLTDNIIIMGIPKKTRQLFYGDRQKCKKEEDYEQTQS